MARRGNTTTTTTRRAASSNSGKDWALPKVVATVRGFMDVITPEYTEHVEGVAAMFRGERTDLGKRAHEDYERLGRQAAEVFRQLGRSGQEVELDKVVESIAVIALEGRNQNVIARVRLACSKAVNDLDVLPKGMLEKAGDFVFGDDVDDIAEDVQATSPGSGTGGASYTGSAPGLDLDDLTNAAGMVLNLIGG